jgi:hypothetical protein
MNTANPQEVKEQAKKQKSARDREVDDVFFLLGTPQGRRFIWRYLEQCGLFASSFHHSGSQMYFNEGQRNVGLRLLADVNEANPAAYVTMMQEAKEKT